MPANASHPPPRWWLRRGTPTSGGEWMPIDGPMTVAAALRSRGEWSLDGPPADFDAHDWTFRATFDSVEAGAPAELALDGVATIAEVQLNGEALLSSSNMFVGHRVALDGRLRANNELLIHCTALAEALKARRPRPRWRAPMVPAAQLRWWRTTLLGRTPGWSPPAAAVGPWRDVQIGRPDVRAGMQRQATLEGTTGVVRCEGPARLAGTVLRLRRRDRTWDCAFQDRGGSCIAEIRIPAAAPWWPHTHGEPALYEAALVTGGEVQALPPVGFRTIEVDTAGGGFEVRVNGERVFCRGAVWMPPDPVALRSSAPVYEAAVAQAAEAGMNMLRVAGTTVYEDDAFYEACDRAGMLVWQEFMFANLDYPFEDAAFAASVETEARQQLERLAPHACLAVLCGNSEVQQQAAMWGAPRERWQPPLFHEALPAWSAALAPGVPYWPSSAWGGAFPHQPDTGTTSYYGVGAYLRPQDDARRSGVRFATECLAFANIPEAGSLPAGTGGAPAHVHHPEWKARSPRDLGAGWDFDDVRDHYVESLFRVDARRLRSEDPGRYLALGRVAVAETMNAAFAEWRRPASRCDGALVLMLRDLWPGAGWGLVDARGEPKSAWHALARALQPVAVHVTDEGLNGLAVHVINESARALDATLELLAWRDGDVQVAHGSVPVELPPRSSRTIAAASLLDHFADLNHAFRFGPPMCEGVAFTLASPGGDVLARAFHFPVGLGVSPDAAPALEARMDMTPAGEAWLTLEARRFAPGVHFDFPGLRPWRQYFHLAPGQRERVRFDAPSGFAPGTVHAVNARGAVRVAMASIAAAGEQRA